MTVRPTITALVALTLMLTACGSGSSGDGGDEQTSSPPQTTGHDDHGDEETNSAAERDGTTAATIEQLRRMDPQRTSHSALHGADGHEAHPTRDLPNSVDPERIVIDAIGVDADIIELGYEPNGEIEVPSDFAQTGWFTDSPRPGRVGSSVLAGHVDSRDGPAVFYRLAELEVGDEIEVHGTDGDVVVFEVTGSEQHAKSEFPAEEVHRSTGQPELKLVTCGGVFDTDERSYRDNIIVSAQRADGG